MDVRVNDRIYNLNNDNYLDEGHEGISYRVDNEVIKVYNKSPKLCLSHEDVQRLKGVSVRVLDHPIDSAYSIDDNYLGPVSKYVASNGYYSISNFDASKFCEVVDMLLLDSKTYAKEHYMIGDLQYIDGIIDKDKQLHLIDSGSYSYQPSFDVLELEKINKEEIDSYLVDEVIDYLLAKKNVSYKKREKIKEDIKSHEDVSVYLKEEVSKYDSVDAYISGLKRK